MPFSGEEKKMAVNNIIKKPWIGKSEEEYLGGFGGRKNKGKNDVIIL